MRPQLQMREPQRARAALAAPVEETEDIVSDLRSGLVEARFANSHLN
jgi:hypothetical protein